MHNRKRTIPAFLYRKLIRKNISLTAILFFLPGIAYVANLNLGFSLDQTMWAWISSLFVIMGSVILYFNGKKIVRLVNLIMYGKVGKALLTETFENTSGDKKLYKLVFVIKSEIHQFTFSEEISNELTFSIGHTYLAIYLPENPEDARIAELILPELNEWLEQEL